MTNFERYKQDIIDFMGDTEELHPAVVGGKLKNCSTTLCAHCELRTDEMTSVGCRSLDFFKWLCKDYDERPTMTKREMAFCQFVQGGYIARDGKECGGEVYWHKEEPQKDIGKGEWLENRTFFIKNMYICISDIIPDAFPFITWEDEEPRAVKDLLELEGVDE